MHPITRFAVLKMIDTISLPITLASSLWLAQVKRGLHRMPFSRRLLRQVGMMPVRHHYYEPLVFPKDLRKPLDQRRSVPGLDLNVAEQLELLKKFNYNEELEALPLATPGDVSFYYLNDFFGPGDAEILFSMIRHYKPTNLIEIGSGYSTLMARQAIAKNTQDDHTYRCHHICIEPNENPWLEKTGANVLRTKVEDLDTSYFSNLRENDFLFIDSSHVIRPQGDVLYEYLELLGTLKSGVFIHIHDIFTPRDYLARWVLTESKLYNEQYLLEAFLSFNDQFRVICSINHLWHDYQQQLEQVCPVLRKERALEPGSFWLVRN